MARERRASHGGICFVSRQAACLAAPVGYPAALALPPYIEVPERPWETPVGNPRPRRAKKDLSPLVRPRGAQRAPWDSWANIAPAQNAIINVIVKRLNWVSFSCASTQAASGVGQTYFSFLVPVGQTYFQ